MIKIIGNIIESNLNTEENKLEATLACHTKVNGRSNPVYMRIVIPCKNSTTRTYLEENFKINEVASVEGYLISEQKSRLTQDVLMVRKVEVLQESHLYNVTQTLSDERRQQRLLNGLSRAECTAKVLRPPVSRAVKTKNGEKWLTTLYVQPTEGEKTFPPITLQEWTPALSPHVSLKVGAQIKVKGAALTQKERLTPNGMIRSVHIEVETLSEVAKNTRKAKLSFAS